MLELGPRLVQSLLFGLVLLLLCVKCLLPLLELLRVVAGDKFDTRGKVCDTFLCVFQRRAGFQAFPGFLDPLALQQGSLCCLLLTAQLREPALLCQQHVLAVLHSIVIFPGDLIGVDQFFGSRGAILVVELAARLTDVIAPG